MKEIKIECRRCNGTGLYQDITEPDECAVICTSCEGKGFVIFKYTEFTMRKFNFRIKRVFKKACGYIHTHEDFIREDGKVIKFSEGGCSYEEWLNGEHPKPVKDLYCPYLWDNRGMGNKPCSRCIDAPSVIGLCEHSNDKANCWKEYEERTATCQ